MVNSTWEKTDCICLAYSAESLFIDKKSCMRKYDLCSDKSPSKQRQPFCGVSQCDMWYQYAWGSLLLKLQLYKWDRGERKVLITQFSWGEREVWQWVKGKQADSRCIAVIKDEQMVQIRLYIKIYLNSSTDSSESAQLVDRHRMMMQTDSASRNMTISAATNSYENCL